MPQNRSLYRRYRATFGIFPAMIPLIEILPWVLGFIGTLAGGVGWMQGYMAFHHRYRVAIYVVMTLSFVAAGSLYFWEKSRIPPDDTGSMMTVLADLPTMTTIRENPAYTLAPQGTVWNANRPDMLWSVSSADELLGSPVIANDLIMFGTFAGTLEARSLQDGNSVWVIKKHQPIFTTPLVSGDTLLIGEGLHTADVSGFTAFSLSQGKALWDRKFASHIESYPAIDVDNHRLWMGAGSMGLWALDMRDGRKLWWAKIGHIDIAPLYADGRLYVAAKLSEESDGSAFFEIDPDNGDVLWSVPLDGNPMGKIMNLGGGKFLVSTAIGQVGLNKDTDAGWLAGIDINHSKKLRWVTKVATMGLPEGQLSIDKTRAYYALKNGSMICVDAQAGTQIWSGSFGDEFKTDVTLYEETGHTPRVIGLTSDGIVHIVDALTGKELQKIDVGKGSYSAPLYHRGILYVANNHNIHAFRVVQQEK